VQQKKSCNDFFFIVAAIKEYLFLLDLVNNNNKTIAMKLPTRYDCLSRQYTTTIDKRKTDESREKTLAAKPVPVFAKISTSPA